MMANRSVIARSETTKQSRNREMRLPRFPTGARNDDIKELNTVKSDMDVGSNLC